MSHETSNRSSDARWEGPPAASRDLAPAATAGMVTTADPLERKTGWNRAPDVGGVWRDLPGKLWER